MNEAETSKLLEQHTQVPDKLSLKWSFFTDDEGNRYPYCPHEPFPKQLAFLMLPHTEALFGGAAGPGKLLSKDEVILTPFGFKKCTDLKVGDRVNNPDGTTSRIIQLHPWGKHEKWTVHFHDGTSTVVTGDHLWKAWRSGKRKKLPQGKSHFGEPAEVIETRELKEWTDKARKQQKEKKRPNWACIPICEEQPFNKTQKRSSRLDAYLLGMWLGDGHYSSSQIGITSVDINHIKSVLGVYNYNNYKEKTWYFKGKSFSFWKHELDRLGLEGTKAHTKFVPKEFLWGPSIRRRSILQGLMDTDGAVDKAGDVSFCSTSKQLAKDVIFLVQSLGGTATLSTKEPFYKDEDEKRVYCRKAYILYIKHRKEKTLFRLKRKKDRCKSSPGNMYRRVIKVTHSKKKIEGRCITVSHPNGLYLTNDFIVTHNSDALLMAALQYVDVPGYAAIIFRKTFTDLKLPGALIDRSLEWLSDTPAKWNSINHQWTFPSGAKLQFGYLSDEMAKYRYQSSEYHFIGFDELTQFYDEDYNYLWSRLRKTYCPNHQDKPSSDCQLCVEYSYLANVPLRMRGATNPGGRGHKWVKDYFKIRKDHRTGMYTGHNLDAPFVPGFVSDNPALKADEYAKSLSHLDPVTKAQLLKGDWGVTEDGRFKMSWIQYYSISASVPNIYIVLGKDRKGEAFRIDKTRCALFVDPAASVREGPGDKQIWRRMPSWTVIGTFLLVNNRHLVWFRNCRIQKEVPDVIKAIKEEYAFMKTTHNIIPEFIGIEDSGLGIGVFQQVRQDGFNVRPLKPKSLDKLVRATPVANRMKQGSVWFPQTAPWLEDLEGEVFSWTGHPQETADQIDTMAYAGQWVDEETIMKTINDVPGVH